jgi:hypothetical protein
MLDYLAKHSHPAMPILRNANLNLQALWPASLRNVNVRTIDSLGNSSCHEDRGHRVNYWEIIADNLKKRGWSYGYVSAVDSNGPTEPTFKIVKT